MYKSKIEKELRRVVKNLGFVPPSDIVLSISEKGQFGDYSSNIALQLSKQKHQNSYQNPREIANSIIDELGYPPYIERIEAAGPGFLNFFIKDSEIVKVLSSQEDQDGLLDQDDIKRIIVEFCDPNTHKMLHIGHLLQLTLGESMARMYEYQGHEVIRTNYGSDIGLTVAKCLWAINNMNHVSSVMGQDFEQIREKSLKEKAEFLGKAYAYAHAEYEKSLDVKEEIDKITNQLYQRDPAIQNLWDETKEWSLGYFELIYSYFGTLFDKRINESEVDVIGKDIVSTHVGKVFVKDQGAIIFPGEKHNLHNRVFINSKGNPTYEGKEVGLAEKYLQLYQFDTLNIFSHKEQDDYFKVVILANSLLFPELKGKVNHISYGEVRLPSGKMSSRTGNIVSAEDILEEAKTNIREVSADLKDDSVLRLAVAAIKFAFLKYSPSSDIIYDINESVSIHGDTGPYVMYVYARIQSLLRKSQNRATGFEAKEEEGYGQDEGIAQNEDPGSTVKGQRESKSGEFENLKLGKDYELEPEEREVLRQLEYFESVVQRATDIFAPNELVKYLLGLTKAFNTFYEKHHIVGSKDQEFRLLLARKTAEIIKLGLYLLGIETVERM